MKARWFVRGDVDGFFGLFVDNLLQLMLIATLCPIICGIPSDVVTHRILPGAAVSILFGNLFYAWQARRLAERTGRNDVTALPYGINTVSLYAFIFLVMGPVYQATNHNATVAWQAGIFACFLSGVLEIAGAFAGDALRRYTPRAALLSALAGIAITFISMGFVFQIFASPVVAIVPMMLILVFYASRVRLPFGAPGGLVAVTLGVAIAWGSRALHLPFFLPSEVPVELGFHPPVPVPGDLFALLMSPHGWSYLSIVVPMALVNVVGSLQNLESADAAGDRYETRSSLLVNGVSSVVAAMFGSAFPTTIYIGHPGWKAMGARTGYSVLNGAAITLICLTGGVGLVLKFVPIEATLGILLWIGLIITAQAFQQVPRHHALAVALGIIPSLAAWALLLIGHSLRAAGGSLSEAAANFHDTLYIQGVFSLSQGFLFTSMIFSAIMVFAIERQFLKAAGWTFAAALLSTVGVIHAYTLTPHGLENKFGLMVAPQFAAAYAVLGCILLALHAFAKGSDELKPQPARHDDDRG